MRQKEVYEFEEVYKPTDLEAINNRYKFMADITRTADKNYSIKN